MGKRNAGRTSTNSAALARTPPEAGLTPPTRRSRRLRGPPPRISPERCFAPSPPPPLANYSTDLDGDLAVVTSYFNPCGYRLRREHYDRFAENLDRQGVPLFTVELTIRDRPAVLRQYPNVRILGSDQVLWHKERLLNLLIRSLPSRFDKVAWIDADVLLQDPDWPARLQEVLRRVPITQLFSELLLLDRLGHPFSKRQGVASAADRKSVV